MVLSPEQRLFTSVTLRCCGLDQIPNELSPHFPDLEALALPHNKIADLSPLARAHPPLTHVDFSFNALAHVPALQLPSLLSANFAYNPTLTLAPDWFLSVPGLRELNLSGCRLAALPRGLFSLHQLQKLEVKDNVLTAIDAELANLSQLYHIDLSNNDLQEIPPELSHLKLLRALLIDGNPLRRMRRLVTLPTPAVLEYLKNRLG
eukprot:GCRY01008752.1.p1 GENE.GCRY01008752.1~~GCRY01008752.1.p1  ORF type:complete len:205 (-),score=39.02 GCRY01008752.1:61-675(-)